MKFLKPKIYKLKNQNNWTLAYIHPETNKRIRKRFPRKKDATVYLQELSYSFIQNRENFLKNDKIGLLIEDFSKKYPETIFYKTKKVADLFIKEFKNYRLNDLTPFALKNWFIKIRKQENYSLKSLANYQYQIGAFFGYLVRKGYIAESPIKKLKFHHRIDIYKRNCLSITDVELIFEHLFYMSPFFLYRVFKVMYFTRLTLREITDIHWDHVDLIRNSISIINPKSGFVRYVRIEPELIKIIETFPKTNKYLLVNRYNKKIDHTLVGRHLMRLRATYPKLVYFNSDIFRDTAGFHFLERGGTLKELKNNMGHSDVEITKRLFTEPKKKFYSQTQVTKEETLSDDWGIEIIS
tara:strand:+ start:5429 stop:6484 length:1056 start_codon:yes stop_codon:yes gene_type:complete